MRALIANLILFISGCTFASGQSTALPLQKPQAAPPSAQTCPQPGPTPKDTKYTDTNGVIWQRHIFTEARAGHRTLLLVMDEALNANLLPKVVLRQSFAAGESAKLARAKAFASTVTNASLAPDLTPSNNPVWPITQPWSEQAEEDYDAWIHKIAAEDFLAGGGVIVDCADYAIALRWIYSHDHQLPAGDNLAAGKGLFGSWQSTVEWDKLPTDPDWKKDERFKAALRFVLDGTFTHTLFTDLYPVAITPDYVTPGTIFLTLTGDSGHTRTIFSVGVNSQCSQTPDCILIIWGNEPASEQGFITEFVPSKLAADEGGFLRFRWPEQTATGTWQLHPADQMRGYSIEQYGWSDNNYLDMVSQRLDLWQTPEAKMKNAGDTTYQLLIQRLFVTQEGYVMCSLVPCTTADPIYVNYSTPVRDRAIARSVQTFQAAYSQVDPSSQAAQDFKDSFSTPMFNGAPFTVFDILTTDINTHFNSDPSVDYLARWGVSTLANYPRTQALSELARNNWQLRQMLVARAQALCFANGDATVTCDPCDPKVQALATDRLDQGLRSLRQTYLSVYAKLTDNEKSDADQVLQTYTDDNLYCGTDGSTQCSLYDYFMAPVDHWAVMTSNPDSPRQKRYGF